MVGDGPDQRLALPGAAPHLPGTPPGQRLARRLLRDQQLEDQPPLRTVPHHRGPAGRLPRHLRRHPEDLKQGKITISARNQSVTGWDFGVSGPWSSLTHQQDDPLPTHNITVTRRPTGEALVYLVATSTP